jgi:hypothetical protein
LCLSEGGLAGVGKALFLQGPTAARLEWYRVTLTAGWNPQLSKYAGISCRHILNSLERRLIHVLLPWRLVFVGLSWRLVFVGLSWWLIPVHLGRRLVYACLSWGLIDALLRWRLVGVFLRRWLIIDVGRLGG